MPDMTAGYGIAADLFPDCVRCACMRVQDAPQDLYDAERPFIERAVEKRRREFCAGRCCARQALRQLGFADAPIGQDENGAPVWPEGSVGAITHSSTYAAAAVARGDLLRGIGIDLETVSRVSAVISSKVLTRPEELLLRAHADPGQRQRLLALIFSAKEAVYKCLHPIVQCRIGFEDARIVCDVRKPGIGIHLSARVLSVLPEARFLSGRWCCFNDTVCTAVWLAN